MDAENTAPRGLPRGADLVLEAWERVESQLTSGFTEDLTQAWDLAVQEHAGQQDKAGNDYFLYHVVPVTLRAIGLAPVTLRGPVAVAALLHDTVEDTDVTLAQIEQTFGRETRNDIDALTRRQIGTLRGGKLPIWEEYRLYVERACGRPVSTIVKVADNLTNGDPARLALIPNLMTREVLRDRYDAVRKPLMAAYREHLIALNQAG